jgi:GT2 family glycosyltransferase
MIEVDIIIIARNGVKMTMDCIESILRYHNDIIYQITLVDNDSTDDTVKLVRKNYPNVKIIQNQENYGYAKAVNIGFQNTKCEYVAVCNNDTLFHSNTLKPMIQALEKDQKIGIIGPQQLDIMGEKGLSYGDLPGYIPAIKEVFFLDILSEAKKTLFEKFGIESGKDIRQVGYIDGGFMLIRRKAYNLVDGFDEDYFFYSEEADFCSRLKKSGWKVVFQPRSELTHYRGGVSESGGFSKKGIEMLVSSKALFCKKNLSAKEGAFYLKALRSRFKIWLILHKILPNSKIFHKFLMKKEIHQWFYDALTKEI